jgi:hypothetical protein
MIASHLKHYVTCGIVYWCYFTDFEIYAELDIQSLQMKFSNLRNIEIDIYLY